MLTPVLPSKFLADVSSSEWYFLYKKLFFPFCTGDVCTHEKVNKNREDVVFSDRICHLKYNLTEGEKQLQFFTVPPRLKHRRLTNIPRPHMHVAFNELAGKDGFAYCTHTNRKRVWLNEWMNSNVPGLVEGCVPVYRAVSIHKTVPKVNTVWVKEQSALFVSDKTRSWSQKHNWRNHSICVLAKRCSAYYICCPFC